MALLQLVQRYNRFIDNEMPSRFDSNGMLIKENISIPTLEANVVVLKHTYRYGNSIVYIAPDYGVIAITQDGKRVMQLDCRVAR